MNVKSFCTKVSALVIAISLLLSSFNTFLALGTENNNTSPYKNFVIFGDSICLGFSTADASMADASTYDIIKNAMYNRYPHSYPSLFGQRIGLDVDATDDGHTDLYNLGVCAAWSSDIYKLITDPFYDYQYYLTKYDENTLFTLPEDYTGNRYIVDTTVPGYDVGNPGTWVYKMNAEGTDYLGAEQYTIPAGTKIHVAYNIDLWGTQYLTLNNAIAEKYFYISRKCVNSNGDYIDTNKDGKVDASDIIYYPTRFDFNSFSFVPSTDPAVVAEYGESFRNPEWNMYYYDFAIDKIKNGDLIALAAGGNDIYHSFMPYQQNSGTTLGNLMYWITYMLQMNSSIGDIANAITGPDSDWIWDMINADNSAADTMALSAGVNPQGLPENSGSLVSANEVAKLLEYYSEENISAYMADIVADYKVNLEKTILRMNELRSDDSELLLMSHFNPFGMRNYLEMISQNLQNGKLTENLSDDAATLIELLKAFFGSPEDYEKFANLSNNQQEKAIADMSNQINNIINTIKSNPNISDAKLTKMFVDTSYPIAVLMAGNGLSGVYTEMNNYVKEMADKYDLVFVDISGAPSSGRYDPHPTADGHKWIADRLYDTVNPTITASICAAGTGSGKISNDGVTTLKLRDSIEYRFVPATGSKISAVYVDGKLLPKDKYPNVYSSGTYVFENVKESHTISVQFDYAMDYYPKFCVDVLGCYNNIGGEGLYAPGSVVQIDAGVIDGYEFTGWIGDNVKFENSLNPQTTFVMPKHDVRIIATWRPVVDSESPQPQYNTLQFETNCDAKVDEITVLEGTVINVDNIDKPEREGYTFAGWYYDSKLTVRVHELPINANVTLYAKWIENSKIDALASPIVASVSPSSTGYGTLSSLGTSLILPGDFKEYRMIASDDSYITAIFIDGIYLNPFNPVYKRVYDSGVYVFEDVNKPHTIMVQFSSILDSLPRYVVDVLGSYAPHTAGEGLYRNGDIVYIDAGELNGYVFDGWEAEGVELADPDEPQTWFFMTDSNIKVKAKWRPLYNLTFETNNGSEIDRLTLPKDTVIDLDDYITERHNFDFAGWYNDSEFTDAVETHKFKGNDIIYAKWSSTLNFETFGGSQIESITADENTVIKLDKYIPVKNGYYFAGWYLDDEFTQRAETYTFAGHTTLYAKWNVVPNSPKTGDHTNVSAMLWMTLLGCSFVSMTISVELVKKFKKKDSE